MRMWVYAARHDVLATGVNNCRALRRFQPVANRGDLAIFTKYVCTECAIRIDDGATLY
jgi:hypothetical protein